MTRTPFVGGWYADALPSGAYAVLLGETAILTHQGRLALPGENVLFVRVTDEGWFQVAGQGNGSGLAWLHDGTTWTSHGLAHGVSPVLFDLAGVLHVSDGSIGSQGWRYAAHDGTPEGRLVTGDATYGPFHGLFEYSQAADLWIGQAAFDGGGVQVWDGTTLRQLEPGNCRFIRVQWAGDAVAIAFVTPSGAVIYQATLDELRALPPVNAPPAPPPEPEPEPEPSMANLDRIKALRSQVHADPGFTLRLEADSAATTARSIRFLSEVVRRAHAEGIREVGLLWKPGRGINADNLTVREGAVITHYDVISGADGLDKGGNHTYEPRLLWRNNGPIQAGWEQRFPDAIEPEPDPPPVDPPPVDPPPPSGDVAARLAALERRVAALETRRYAIVIEPLP